MISNTKAPETPQGNTGVNATEENSRKVSPDLRYRLDWLQGTFSIKHLKKVQRYVNNLFGKGIYTQQTEEERKNNLKLADGHFIERPYGVRYFNRSYLHPSGALMASGRKLPEGEIDDSMAYLELSGKVLMTVRQSKIRKLMRVLYKRCGFHPTRLDLCIDDFAKSLNILQIKKASDKHQYVGFGDTVKFHSKGRKGLKGLSVSFGSRGSSGGGKYFLIYDKSAESNGQIDSVRMELSCYQHYAEQAFQNLCEADYLCWGEVIKSWVAGCIDFRNRKDEKDKNPGRRRRLRWWARIVKDAVPIKAGKQYDPQTIEKIKSWFHRQIAPSLVVLIEVLGKLDIQVFWEFFWEIIADGEARLKEKHRWLIAKG